MKAFVFFYFEYFLMREGVMFLVLILGKGYGLASEQDVRKILGAIGPEAWLVR
jgi:hypothetical protein